MIQKKLNTSGNYFKEMQHIVLKGDHLNHFYFLIGHQRKIKDFFIKEYKKKID